MTEQGPTSWPGSPEDPATDYGTLLPGLQNHIDAQVELLQALSTAGEMAMMHKGSGLDAFIDPFALTVMDDCAGEPAKLEAQMDFYDEVVRKRDSEL